MIVPSMSLAEIRKEIEKDFPIIFRKMQYVALDLDKKLSKDVKKNGYLQHFDYLSKYKNQWFYRVSFKNKIPNYMAMLHYHNGKGHAAICATNELNIIYHTGHFFIRYNERRKLGLNTINDIIRAYMEETGTFKFQELEEIDKGIFKVFGKIPSGIVLGIFNKPLMLVKANTFVANETLTKNQIELNKELIETLEKYKHSSSDLD